LKPTHALPAFPVKKVEILQCMATTTLQMGGGKTNGKRKSPNCFKVFI